MDVNRYILFQVKAQSTMAVVQIVVNVLSMYAEKQYDMDTKLLSIGKHFGRDVAFLTNNILNTMCAKASAIRGSYIVKFRYNEVYIRISYYMNVDSVWYHANYDEFIRYIKHTMSDFWKDLGPALDNAEFV